MGLLRYNHPMSSPKPLPDLPLAHLVLPLRKGVFGVSHGSALTTDLQHLVVGIVEKEGWSFSCGEGLPGEEEEVLTAEEIAAPDGMLPVIIREAARLMRLAMGSEPQVRWASVDRSLCNLRPADQQEESASLAVWGVFCHYALETMVGANPKSALEGEPASLTKWREAFLADIDRGELRPVSFPSATPRSSPDVLAPREPSPRQDAGGMGN